MDVKHTAPVADIKILVACHKCAYVPTMPLLYPIQVGAALADKCLEGMLHDDKGDNISIRNRSFCELTAIYWAWKNLSADYYGLFHYRRYLAFDNSLKTDEWGNVDVDRITEDTLNKFGIIEDKMRKSISENDAVVVRARKYTRFNSVAGHRTVYDEYDAVPYQHQKDLDVALEILLEKYPAYRPYANQYMKSNSAFECNMFILRRDIFRDYCEWLFDILFEAERRIDIAQYTCEETRVFGYLAERLCGIYFTRLKAEKYRILELPKIYIKDTEPIHYEQVIRPVFKNSIPVVLAANDKFAPHLDIMIRSVIANADKLRKYDIVVFHNDITQLNQNIISSASFGKSNISIRFICVAEHFDQSKFFVDQHLSIETYYRLMILELMPDYHKILYLDCDMVVEKDVAILFDMDLCGNAIAACRDIDVAGQVSLCTNDWEHYATKKLGLDSPFDYFQAGVLVLNLDALREITTSEQMMRLAASEYWRCHDQDVMNIICHNSITYLPLQWNVLMNWEEPTEGRSRMQIIKAAPKTLLSEYEEARKNPYIVHFAGYQKPWNVLDCDFAEHYWKYAALSPYYFEITQRLSTGQIPVKPRKRILLRTIRKIFAFFFPEFSERRKKVFRFVTVFFPYGTKRRAKLEGQFHTILRETEQ